MIDFCANKSSYYSKMQNSNNFANSRVSDCSKKTEIVQLEQDEFVSSKKDKNKKIVNVLAIISALAALGIGITYFLRKGKTNAVDAFPKKPLEELNSSVEEIIEKPVQVIQEAVSKPEVAMLDRVLKLDTEGIATSLSEVVESSNEKFKFSFNDDILAWINKYKDDLFSGSAEIPYKDFASDCARERNKIAVAYDELVSLASSTQDPVRLQEIQAQIADLIRRNQVLSQDVVIDDILRFKSELDALDPQIFKDMLQKVNGSSDTIYSLRNELAQQVGIRQFKTSPVYMEMLEAADELKLDGSEEDKIRKLISLASDEKIGHGVEGYVFHIPNTNLAIKTTSSKCIAPKSFDDFCYTVGNNEYEAVNNVLAMNGSYEIQEYIDALRISRLNSEYDVIVDNMPQEAYDNLLRRIVRINKADRGLDTCANNLMVDAINGRFVPVDLHCSAKIESEYRTKIDSLGRNFIDPLAHTLLPLGSTQNLTSQKIRTGKILKSIAKDMDNYKMYLFDTDFYASKFGLEPSRTIYDALKAVDTKLAAEIDEAFAQMQKVKLELGDSAKESDVKKVRGAIDSFCALIDKKLLQGHKDIELSELARKQVAANRQALEAKYTKKLEEILEEQLEDSVQSPRHLEIYQKKIARIKDACSSALSAFDKKYAQYS